MASKVLNDKANGTRLSRLLVDKGTQVLREAFHDVHPPSTLAAVLSTNKPKLKPLRYKVINTSQWKLLYPASGPPDSENFDVTLLTILLRNICGLASPATGWSNMPPDSDTSTEANILRIKLYRNEVYAHISTTEVSDHDFENLWQQISKAFISLGTPPSEIEELKEDPLSPEEANYIQQLKDWREAEAELKAISLDIYAAVKESEAGIKARLEAGQATLEAGQARLEAGQEGLKAGQEGLKALIENREQKSHESRNVSKINILGKCDFRGNIRSLTNYFQPGTRKWLFDKLSSWFADKESESTVMILTAGPGVGKSMFAAKVCEMYAEEKQLAACHFCKYNNSDYRNPRMIIESLASNMCENVKGFKAKLEEQLERSHSQDTLSDAFRVLLNDPLHALGECEPMILVIDALDESQVEGKSDLLELISQEFSKLPQWIKILITSRPELPVQKELKHLNPLEISAVDKDNDSDLLSYFWSNLSHICDNLGVLSSLVKQCQGSFLFAYHTQMDLKKTKEQLTMENVSELVPKGISGFYEKQFKRLRDHLHDLAPSKLNLKCFLEILVAAKGPLPLSLLPECLGLPDNANYEVRKRVNDIMSLILPVYDDCLTVYHKSLIDWLTSVGYEEHLFTVDCQSGHAHLWKACEKVLINININKLTTLSNLKRTAMTRYALSYGIHHMIHTGDVTSFHWLVDVKTICTLIYWNYDGIDELVCFWGDVLENPDLSTVLREDLEWHNDTFSPIFSCSTITCGCAVAFYLQSVANRIHFPDGQYDKRDTAKLLLKERGYFWFEDLGASELTKHHRVPIIHLPAEVTCVSVSFDKELVAVGCKDGSISVFQHPDFEKVFTHNTRLKSGVPWCTFAPDKSILLYGRLDRCLDLNKKEELPFFDGDCGTLLACSFSPSGHRLVTCDGSHQVKLWDVNNRNLIQSLQAGGSVDCCSFSESGFFIVANKEGFKEGCSNPTDVFTVWNAFTLQRVDRRNISRNFKCKDSKVSKEKKTQNEIILSRNGDDIDIFELPHALPTARLDGRQFPSLPVVARYRGRNCILFSECGKIMVRDPVQDTLVASHIFLYAPLGTKADAIYKVQGFYVVLCSATLYVFRMTAYQSLNRISCCSFSPDGSFLATCVDAGPSCIWVWDTKLCTVVQTVPSPAIGATACWWSANSFWIYDGGLIKLPVADSGTIKTLGAKRIAIDWKLSDFLNFSDVVIFIDVKKSVKVVKIIDGELQHVQNLINYVENSVCCCCAAASLDNSIIFTANSKEFQIWKEVNTGTSPHWVASVTEKIADLNFSVGDFVIFRVRCCITSDSTIGVLVYGVDESLDEMTSSVDTFFVRCCFILQVNLNSGEILRKFEGLQCDISRFLYAGNSYYCVESFRGDCMFVFSLKNNDVVAIWDTFCLDAAFYSKGNLLAIFRNCDWKFLKMHVPD